jgi:ubiquinone/menaquinone biosynthesis C-methylase UbiE
LPAHLIRTVYRKGAKVVSVDFSEKLIELAKQMENEKMLGIDYYVCDAADLREFSGDYFDGATCFMALMDIEGYEAAIHEVARVMKKEGRFIFLITHPCFEWGGHSGEWTDYRRLEI